MKKHVLRMRAADRESSFDMIVNGKKTVETRAATEKYRSVELGDALVFVCDGEKQERIVKKSTHFKSLDDLFKHYPWQKIRPDCKTVEDAKRAYDAFDGYKEKLAKHGVMAFDLEQ